MKATPSLYEQIGDELVGPSEPSWSALVQGVPALDELDRTPQSPMHHAYRPH